MNFKVFCRDMRSYKAFKEDIRRLNETIDDILYKYAGVRGIRYDRQPMSFSPELAIDVRQKMLDELSDPQKKLDRAERRVKECEENLAKLPKDVREMCIDLFIEEKTYEAVCMRFGYTSTGLWRKVKREVEKL